MDPHANHFDLDDWLHYFDEVDPPHCWNQTLDKLDSIQVSPLLREEQTDVYGFEFPYFDMDEHLSCRWEWWDDHGLPSLGHIDDNSVDCHGASGEAHNPTISDVGVTNDDGGGHRAGKRGRLLEFEEIEKCFELPITMAAKELNVGLTVLKKRCRELNIKRWPHRKLKSLNSLIHNVKELGIKGEIEMLEEQKRMMEKVPEMELNQRTKKLRQAIFKASYKKRRSINNPPATPLFYYP